MRTWVIEDPSYSIINCIITQWTFCSIKDACVSSFSLDTTQDVTNMSSCRVQGHFPGSLNILLLPRQQHILVWQVVTHKHTLVLGYTTGHQASFIPRPSPQLWEAWEWGYHHYGYVSWAKDWAGTLTIGYSLESNPQSWQHFSPKWPFSGRYNIQWAIPRVPPYGWQRCLPTPGQKCLAWHP